MKTPIKMGGIAGVNGKMRKPPAPTPKPKTLPSPASKQAPRNGGTNQSTRIVQGFPWQKAKEIKK